MLNPINRVAYPSAHRYHKNNAEKIAENQWRSGSASDSNAKGSGFEPRKGQGFSSSYEMPEILGAGDSHVLRMRR
jgi:hypothetical protein